MSVKVLYYPTKLYQLWAGRMLFYVNFAVFILCDTLNNYFPVLELIVT